MSEMRKWLKEDEVAAGAIDPAWPTSQSHGLWLQFIESLSPSRRNRWRKREATLKVLWDAGNPNAGTPVRLHNDRRRGTLVLDADFTRLGRLKSQINKNPIGLVQATVARDEAYLNVTYFGPNDLKAVLST